MTCEIFTYSVQFLLTYYSSHRVGLCPNINLLFYIVSWIVGPCKCTSGLFWYSGCLPSSVNFQAHKKVETMYFQGFHFSFRAADGNRTRDLRTTNATLYRLSHSSITWLLTQSPCYILSKVSHFVNRIILNYIFFLHNSFIMLSVTSLRISSGGISLPIWWHWYIR